MSTILDNSSYIPVNGTGENLETIKIMDDDGATVHREAVFMGGVLDAQNSTTTSLGAGETFTGQWMRVPDGVQVSCKSDVAGTLYFDFSNDETNVDTFPPGGFTVSAGIHEYHNAKSGGRFFRVRYINGASAQSYLRLYVYHVPYSIGNAPINHTIAEDADAQVVKSVISGIGDTTARVTDHGALQVTPPPEGKTAFGQASVAEDNNGYSGLAFFIGYTQAR